MTEVEKLKAQVASLMEANAKLQAAKLEELLKAISVKLTTGGLFYFRVPGSVSGGFNLAPWVLEAFNSAWPSLYAACKAFPVEKVATSNEHSAALKLAWETANPEAAKEKAARDAKWAAKRK